MAVGCRASTDWRFKGMRTLVMENEKIRLAFLLDFGARAVEFLYKPLDHELLWRNPLVEHSPPLPLHPAPGPSSILDCWGGGWEDVFPTAWPCKYKGAEFGFFGELSYLPWKCELEKNSREEVTAHLWVNCVKAPFTFHKWITLRSGEPVVHVRERVVNRAGVEYEFLLGCHTVFKAEPGYRVDVPAEEALVEPGQALRFPPGSKHRWPVLRDVNGREVDMSVLPPREEEHWELFYLTGLREGWCALTNPKEKIGVGHVFPKDVFKCVWISLLWGGCKDWPWYGEAYALGLYPWTGYPTTLTKAISNGTCSRLGPREEVEFELKVVVYTGFSRVKGITREEEVKGEP